MKEEQISNSTRIVTYAVILTVVSFLVVLVDSINEPYYRYNVADALMQIGLGMTVIVLWIQLIVGVLYGVRKTLLSRKSLFVIAWAVFVLLGTNLIEQPFGYVREIARNAGKKEPAPFTGLTKY